MKRPVERGEDSDLYDHLLRECVGMAKYALSGGTAIPAAAAETITILVVAVVLMHLYHQVEKAEKITNLQLLAAKACTLEMEVKIVFQTLFGYILAVEEELGMVIMTMGQMVETVEVL